MSGGFHLLPIGYSLVQSGTGRPTLSFLSKTNRATATPPATQSRDTPCKRNDVNRVENQCVAHVVLHKSDAIELETNASHMLYDI